MAITELLPIPSRGGVQLTLSFPLLLSTLVLYAPMTAATVAFVGTFDRKEFDRSLPISSALFNRAEIALSVLFGGLVFHVLADPHMGLGAEAPPLPILAPCLVIATCVAYVTNVTLVVLALRASGQMTVPDALSALRVGALREFLLNYLGLSLIGIVIVELYKATQAVGGGRIHRAARVRPTDVLPHDGSRRGDRGTQGPRTCPASPLKPDGRRAPGRAPADRRLPPRRPRPDPLPTDPPTRDGEEAAQPRRLRSRVEGPRPDRGDQAANGRHGALAGPGPAPRPDRSRRPTGRAREHGRRDDAGYAGSNEGRGGQCSRCHRRSNC